MFKLSVAVMIAILTSIQIVNASCVKFRAYGFLKRNLTDGVNESILVIHDGTNAEKRIKILAANLAQSSLFESMENQFIEANGIFQKKSLVVAKTHFVGLATISQLQFSTKAFENSQSSEAWKLGDRVQCPPKIQ